MSGRTYGPSYVVLHRLSVSLACDIPEGEAGTCSFCISRLAQCLDAEHAPDMGSSQSVHVLNELPSSCPSPRS